MFSPRLHLSGWLLNTFALVALFFGKVPLLQAAQFLPIYAETVGGSNTFTSSSFAPYISSLSGDGTTIAGTLTFLGAIDCAGFECENTAFVWSIDNQQSLKLRSVDLPGTLFSPAYPTRVSALSKDGELALVTSVYRHYETTIQDGQGYHLLREPIILGEWLIGTGMSSDGKVATGYAGNSPFLWKESTGLLPLSGLPTESELLPVNISGNGKTVALADRGRKPGNTLITSSNFSTTENVAIWNELQGLQELEPALGNERALISGMNFDGSVIVGASSHFDGPGSSHTLTATRWDYTIPTALSSVGDFDSTIAQDVSPDGSIVIGVARYEPEPGERVSIRDLRDLRTKDQAVLWKDDEAFLLRDLLVRNFGLAEQLEGWRLTSATAISDDGQTIAGHGIDSSGNSAGWVIVLDIPEPGALPLVATSLLILGASRPPCKPN